MDPATQRLMLGAGSSVRLDSNFREVSLLLHGDGSNGAQNNTFLDSSSNNFTITRNGNVTQGSLSPFGDRWSCFFDGTGDYLTATSSSALELGSGNFTIEWWEYVSINHQSGVISRSGTTGVNGGPWVILGRSDGNIEFWAHDGTGGAWNISSGTVIGARTLNQWTHWAFVRNGSSFKAYKNGVDTGMSLTSSASFAASSSPAVIGNWDGTFNGYISNLRILKGTALYTSAFTPPAAPLTAITNTSLLTCHANRFIDGSSNNFTITRNGDVRVEKVSPFAPAAAYSSATNGASGYFDGSGDYLRVSGSNAAFQLSGDFTFECWFYSVSATTQMVFDTISPGASGGGTDRICFFVNSDRTVSFFSAAQYTTTNTISLGAWNHLALTRSGSTQRIFINGAQGYSGTHTNNYSSGYCTIGLDSASGGTSSTNGYLADCRLLKGTALYTGAFTPPTAPLTAITNTSLLLNFANGGVIDNAGKVVLETVGNAQISTSQKKYGTGALYFDGTGDYLALPSSSALTLDASFTLELWVNFSAIPSNYIALLGGSAVNTQLFISTKSNGSGVRFGLTGVAEYAAGSFAWSTATWYHLALVRNGSDIKFYVNGNNISDSTYSNSTTYTGELRIGGGLGSTVDFNGYIDDLRITKVARYTGNFTPPDRAFPDQ